MTRWKFLNYEPETAKQRHKQNSSFHSCCQNLVD